MNYFKNICIETGKLSTCACKKVGAVLTKDNRILAIGYNGTGPKCKHCNDIFNKKNFNRKNIIFLVNKMNYMQNKI
ncbi:MAG: hypothetical protein KAX49_13120 [Halanaerobiales bacterium]|nr:hypothetical protein [Halanaerobiales bacterium]